MIPGAILLAVKNAPWKLIGIGVAVAFVCALLLTIHLKNKALDDARAENRVLQASVAALRIDAAAKDKAAEERATDTVAVDAMQKGLRDAIKDVPPFTAPGAATRALGCERLRQAGARGTALPAACGPGGGIQAGAGR